MKQFLICLLLVVSFSSMAQSSLPGRNRSVVSEMQRSTTTSTAQQAETYHRQLVDTLLTPRIPFTPVAVTMKGYCKHKNDEYESFVLLNNTENYRISRVLIKLMYISTVDNINFHNREVLVECDIQPSSTQIVNIKSFDKGKNYYHHSVPPTRASGVPYEIKYDILRYDVVVE